MATHEFIIYGTPTPQGSMRAIVNRHTGRAIMMHGKRDAIASFRQAVAVAALERRIEVTAEPVSVAMTFVFERPGYHRGTKGDIKERYMHLRHAAKPDIDKLIRTVLDALTGTVLVDDKQVSTVTASKYYTDDHRPRTIITVEV